MLLVGSVWIVHMLYTVGKSKVEFIMGLMEFWNIESAPFLPYLEGWNVTEGLVEIVLQLN